MPLSRTRKQIHVQAHRGASSEFLENTIPAFHRAIEIGADSIELDIHVTKDDHIVVYHDFELSCQFCHDQAGAKVKPGTPLRSLALSEIKRFDCVDPSRLIVPNLLTMEQRRIPALTELFQLIRSSAHSNAKNIMLDIEIKSDPNHPEWSPPPHEFAARLSKLIGDEWFLDRTIVRSFDHRTLFEWRKLHPKSEIAALTDSGFTEFATLQASLKPNIFAPSFRELSESIVSEIHRGGSRVIPYTVNESKDWERLIRWGVDGITTDNPTKLIKELEK